jgi:heme A synthase
MTTPPQLRAPTFDEAVAIDNYKAASKEALSAANSVTDKIVTAAFSIATAYGAVIALVAPEETPSPLAVAIPFALLAIAVGTALYGQSIGIDLSGDDEVDKLQGIVNNTVKSKRRWSRGALIALALGVLAAGILLRDAYAKPATPESPVSVRVWLNPHGVKALEKTCGPHGPSIAGKVKSIEGFEKRSIPLEVTAAACPSGAGTVVLRRRQVTVVKA